VSRPLTSVPSDKPDPLLLDEMFSPVIAAELTSRGIDCRAVATDSLLRAHSDLEVFEAALRESRIIVTNNVPDFESLRRAHEAVANPVPGLIYTCDAAFPRTRAFTAQITAALAAVASTGAVARHGGVLWLRPDAVALSSA
jgi:predicted nuclease of predicted toxin-antitoxin system